MQDIRKRFGDQGFEHSAPTEVGRRRVSPTRPACTAPTSAQSSGASKTSASSTSSELAATLGVSLAELFEPFKDKPAPPS